MSQYTKYKLYKLQQRISGSSDTWIDVVPTTYSYDGNGTQTPVIVEEQSADCGYVPPIEPIYKWENMNINTDYICDECPIPKNYKLTTNVEVIECDSSSALTSDDTTGYRSQISYADVGDCVTSIGDDTFYCSTAMTTAIIGRNVNYVGSAFDSCYALTSVTIPDSVEVLHYTFMNCRSLKRINSDVNGVFNMPNYLTSLSGSVFYGCSGLTNIEIPNSVSGGLAGTFENCSNLSSVTMSNSISGLGGTFWNCTNLKRVNSNLDGVVNIPNSVTSIGDYCFTNCTSIQIVNLPNSLTNLGVSTFSGCTSLSSINIPTSVTTIGSGAFYNCTHLTSIDIPNSVTSIGVSAFSNCSSATTLTVGSGVTVIGNYAFKYCSNLTSITIYAATPPSLGYSQVSGTNVFNNTNNCPIYVPSASVDTYKSASGWSTYASRIQAITT